MLTPDDVVKLAHEGKANGKTSYWLQPKAYYGEEFEDRWDRIRSGTD